jgi:hypothetical protein
MTNYAALCGFSFRKAGQGREWLNASHSQDFAQYRSGLGLSMGLVKDNHAI